MTEPKKPIEELLQSLQERAKELNCIYAVEEILNRASIERDEVCREVIKVIPPGWQYPELCRARIILYGESYEPADFFETPWWLHADIMIQGHRAGQLSVYYLREVPSSGSGPFLTEESKLIRTIADRLGHFFTYQQMRHVASEVESARRGLIEHPKGEWRVVLDLLRHTDRDLFQRMAQKMLHHLCRMGVPAALQLAHAPQHGFVAEEDDISGDPNRPHRRAIHSYPSDIAEVTFGIASEHLNDDVILADIQDWIQEDKLSFLSMVINRHVTLPVVADALRRYHLLAPKTVSLRSPAKRGVEVALTRRFLSDDVDYINCAKDYIELHDFYDLLQNMIFSPESHGRLGGKSAGLFLATQILKKSQDADGLLASIRMPKTWYITSDVILYFMHYNDLDDVVEQKYKEINQVRQEYPHIVQMFKRSEFPEDIVKALSAALDDFGDCPLIVRSSSLLEDRWGAAFSGKYKSLFLANQGTKDQRLEALMDAISEVYASTFGPDPIEYRTERGLIDFGEEMGIMIQEVVGRRIGPYFLPSSAGVAFSRNEFRWSPRIRRNDGLLRIVPGIGTRAVDRLSDDYPVLIAPGQPTLRVNASVEEVLRYAPRRVDVINLRTNSFETITVEDLLREYGGEIPCVDLMVSVLTSDGHLQPPAIDTDPARDDLVVTFDGLVTRTPFVKQVRAILNLLEEKLQTPVDIEFACDGSDFYILQCRPQSHARAFSPAPIPKDVPSDRMVFSAKRYVTNGQVSGISHIVYVDPHNYSQLPERSDLLAVGKAVGKLNALLPRHKFILMGPGRWGSRGDIKLGVNVTYSEINNTAALIEVARKTGGYVPDLSFGTHFFQDLVEAGILYLPLYPDDDGTVFNEQFLMHSPNLMPRLLPDYAELSDTVRLIDVQTATDGLELRLLMNADLDEAVAILAPPHTELGPPVVAPTPERAPHVNHWQWRMRMAQQIASYLDPDRFGVVAMYVFGSTKNASAGPASDIDLLVHVRGSEDQRRELSLWLDGWSKSLDEVNYLQTGYRTGGLLDVHIVTDEDIANRTSYASKIDAVTDAARPLPLRK